MTIAVTALVSQYRFRPAGNSDPDRFQRPNRTVVHFRSDEQSLVVESIGKHFEKGGARRIRVATAYELEHQSRLANRGAHVGVAVRLSATFEITPEHEGNFGLDSRVRTF